MTADEEVERAELVEPLADCGSGFLEKRAIVLQRRGSPGADAVEYPFQRLRQQSKEGLDHFGCFFLRARATLRAISRRCARVSFLARTLPTAAPLARKISAARVSAARTASNRESGFDTSRVYYRMCFGSDDVS